MIKNAKQLPSVFFGLHFAPGIAEYAEDGKEPLRIFINESTAKKLDPTFQGKPIYVQHVDEVKLSTLERDIDGVVFDSFYNKCDGKHWCRFEVHTDAAHEAIRKGWKLSNAYLIKGAQGAAGTWHGMEYQKEILDGEYEHLALVENPRYSESIILTPAEFKAYNEKKEIELRRLANSKEEKPKMKLNIFKREKIENSLDLESTMVELPISKKEMTIAQVVNELDKVLNMHGYASDEHMVKLNDDEEMSVKDLKKNWGKMKSEMDEMKEKKENETVEEPTEGDELGEKEDKKMYPKNKKKENEGEDDSLEMKPEKKKNEGDNFSKIKNAPKKFEAEENKVVPIYDGVKRGKQLFGSNK